MTWIHIVYGSIFILKRIKMKEKSSEGLACVLSRDSTMLIGYYRAPRRSPECDLVNEDCASSLYTMSPSSHFENASLPHWSVQSLTPSSLALGLNCASGKVFSFPSSPISRVLRNFFSLSRKNLFVNTIDPRLTVCTPSFLASSRLRINCLLKSCVALALVEKLIHKGINYSPD